VTAGVCRRVRRFLETASALLIVPSAQLLAQPSSPSDSETSLTLSAGAYHWFNWSRTAHDFDYGIDGLEGTYFWHLNLDVDHRLSDGINVGLHAEVRTREKDRFRPFIDGRTWIYEAYGSASGRFGTLKAGNVVSRFGLDWDGSFYGNVPYFDGLKLDPDRGISWERPWQINDAFSLASYVQFFTGENDVNGSISGADPESSHLFEEQDTAIVRLVPRWQLGGNGTLQLGVSVLTGEVDNVLGAPHDLDGTAFDASYTVGDFMVYGEATDLEGARHPTHYVTGGPSDEAETNLIGAQYTIGRTTLRYTFSSGDYENPGGRQELRLLGATVAITDNVTFYAEYVDWDVQAAGSPEVKFEDGFQFVLYWSHSAGFRRR
jgi:hypothetical protein